MLYHKGEKKYVCNYCGKDFIISRGLKDHVERTHLGLKPRKCSQCDKSFYAAIELNNHIRNIHTGENPGPALCVINVTVKRQD